jgi:hypothetical protein
MTERTKAYLGDGLYAELDPARMIVLSTERHDRFDTTGVRHWVGLEPEVFYELIRFAHRIGWGDIVRSADPDRMPTDHEYAQQEEAAQRKRDAEEGFPED